MNNSLANQSKSINQANSLVGSSLHSTNVEGTQALAEVQGKIVMAKNFPREMNVVMAKIQGSCERQSLASIAEYQYPKGGAKIQGASIKLLETVAQCYGNIQFSWKEISRDLVKHVSLCKAIAWDLENNIYSELEFEVSHYRDTKSGKQLVKDSERDLYELIASQASRRLRKCLEMVIPRDLVDQAIEWCRNTVLNGVDIQKAIDKAITVFDENFKVKLKQLETYFGYSRQGFNANTYLSLKKLYTSITEGMISVSEIFPSETQKKQTLVDEKEEQVNEETGEVTNPTLEQNNLFDYATKVK